MPLNESKSKVRELWPLEFDLEGVPRDDATRKLLLEQKRNAEAFESLSLSEEPTMNRVTNSFTVDQAPSPTVIDLNNPPKQPYNANDPKNRFPRLVYHHDSGAILEVKDEKQLAVAQKKLGYQLDPSPGHDYSNVKGSIAQPKAAHVPRPDEILAETLSDMDEGEKAGEASEENSETFASQAGEAAENRADSRSADETEAAPQRSSGRRR